MRREVSSDLSVESKSMGEHNLTESLHQEPEVHGATCSGESIAAVSSSPFLETLRKKGIEVPQS